MKVWSNRLLGPLSSSFSRQNYAQLPTSEGQNGSIARSSSPSTEKKRRRTNSARFPALQGVAQVCSLSILLIPLRIFKYPVRLLLFALIILSFLGIFGLFHQDRETTENEIHRQEELHDTEGIADTPQYFWMVFPRLEGFFNGVKTLVPFHEWEPEDSQKDNLRQPKAIKRDEPAVPAAGTAPINSNPTDLPLKPQIFNPYPDFESEEYLSEHPPVKTCYIDMNDSISAPDIFAYPGIPQHMVQPFFGSYKELNLREDVCFERFGRFGPYGYGYTDSDGGLHIGLDSEDLGSNEIWKTQPRINFKGVDWGRAQKRCVEKNIERFRSQSSRTWSGFLIPEADAKGKRRISRTAYVLRTWTGFEYTRHEIMTLRAMINELNLKSGGEYDVHLLLHVHDDQIPIMASEDVRRRIIADNVPEEFRSITTVWSQRMMEAYYPGPFEPTIQNVAGRPIHHVYRSGHFALQWFSQQHPEYDYVWNWEMDVRYSGHLYEFHEGVTKWAKMQPRRGMWERNTKFWIPAYHGNYTNFTRFVDKETVDSGKVPIWGPLTFPNDGMLGYLDEVKPPRSYMDDDFEWGVGEEADFISFNPMFDTQKTNWVFRDDITGYSNDLPPPPRRCAIVTVSRFSRRMLELMHRETYAMKHTAFTEMWPPTAALHHGMKAVYVPHPVFFDRKWPLEYMDQTFNYPKTDIDSPFGWGEHNWLGSSFYFNSAFSAPLWRRWLGQRGNNDVGGAEYEKKGTGRMCLRSTLHHPIKSEDAPTQ